MQKQGRHAYLVPFCRFHRARRADFSRLLLPFSSSMSQALSRCKYDDAREFLPHHARHLTPYAHIYAPLHLQWIDQARFSPPQVDRPNRELGLLTCSNGFAPQDIPRCVLSHALSRNDLYLKSLGLSLNPF